MNLARYSDRLDPATYEDDEPIAIYEEDPGEAGALYISERLFSRLVHLGEAYELHHLPLLGRIEPVQLGRAQCVALCDELAFVAERVDDPLTVAAAQSVSDYLDARVRRPGAETFVTLEGN